MKHQFIETELENWKDVFLLGDKFLKQFLFRGQASKDWEISSSLERLLDRLHPNYSDKSLISTQEDQMIQEFQWKYLLFKDKIIDYNNSVEWLSIMQHYGAATRLVDFTNSFFIASHMAIYESTGDAAVWAINKHVISGNALSLYRTKNNTSYCTQRQLDSFTLDLANKSIESSLNHREDGLLVVRPKNVNERIYRQQGLFVMPTNIEKHFMENLASFLDNKTPTPINFRKLIDLSCSYKQDEFTLLKIKLPQATHKGVLNILREMNINSEILFPGIEGLAKSLNYSKFNNFS